MTSLIQESACDSQTGALMNTSIEDFRLEVGFNFDLTTLDIDIVREYTTDCWYKRLLEFTSGSQISVQGDNYHFETLRDNDAFVMEKFIQAGFRNLELRKLNLIRMH